MSQLVVYWIEDDGFNRVSEEEWEQIELLQKRTNLREYFNRGRVGFVRFTYAPKWPQLYEDSMLPESITPHETERFLEDLIEKGWTWEDLVRANLAVRMAGGLYESDCLMAGRSEISNLRSDLELVMKFLVQVSMIVPECRIRVSIEGNVRIPELVVCGGSIREDYAGIGDQLECFRKAGDSDSAIDLLEAVETGDPLAPKTKQGSSTGCS